MQLSCSSSHFPYEINPPKHSSAQLMASALLKCWRVDSVPSTKLLVVTTPSGFLHWLRDAADVDVCWQHSVVASRQLNSRQMCVVTVERGLSCRYVRSRLLHAARYRNTPRYVVCRQLHLGLQFNRSLVAGRPFETNATKPPVAGWTHVPHGLHRGSKQ